MPIQNQQQWFNTCLGQYLLEREQSYFDQAVMDVFGYNAIQVGFPQHDFLRTNRMPLQFCTGAEEGVSLLAAPDFLPIESNSIDLILLPHILEFNLNPHQILREVQRVLMAEGHVIICGFNPRSLWGVRQWFGSARHGFHICQINFNSKESAFKLFNVHTFFNFFSRQATPKTDRQSKKIIAY